MKEMKDSAFGGQWDLGGAIVENIISYPVSQILKRSADESGIDLDNPVRSIVCLLSSGMLGGILGSFLGPFGAIIGGLLGETLGLAGSYPGDRTKEEKILEEKAWIALRAKAMITAVEITKEHISQNTWRQIVDEYERRVKLLNGMTSTEKEALNIGIDIINNSIYSVDKNVYWNFEKVYRETKRTLGITD